MVPSEASDTDSDFFFICGCRASSSSNISSGLLEDELVVVGAVVSLLTVG